MSTTVGLKLIDAFLPSLCFSVLFLTVPMHTFFWCWHLFQFPIFVGSVACVLQHPVKPKVCPSNTVWSSSQSGTRCGNLSVQLTGFISSLHMVGIAQGHLGVLGWVCSPPGMLELVHYTDIPFWYLHPPSSCLPYVQLACDHASAYMVHHYHC